MRDTKRLIKELEWWWDGMRTDEESDKTHILPETIDRLRALLRVAEAGKKMRESSKTELSEATKAWDAATKGDEK
jgi:DNA replicative helicase MCM subunit Mcm2 (Cdc46/Mcm family)